MYEDKGWNFFARRGEATPLYCVYSKELQRSMAEKFYQEALRTPGISPLYARVRKQTRHTP